MAARILDQFGNPIDLGRLKEPAAEPTPAGVRQVVSGHPSRGLVPARVARLLDAAEQGDSLAYLELAEDIEEKYWHYASVLGNRKRAVTQLEVTVAAASDDADDVKAADLIREWLLSAELDNSLFDMLDAIGKGFSVLEIDWDVSGKVWTPRDLIYRDPRWFEFDRKDGTTLRLRDEGGQLVPLQPYKFITHQARVKSGLPIRSGLGRPATFAWMFQSYTQKDWQAFLEIYGQPLRLGKYHQGASKDERDVLLRAVTRIGADAAAIIPEGMSIDFEAAATSSTDQYERRADWLDRQVSKLVLGQTLTTEVASGSKAAAQVHDGVRADIERSDGKQGAATLTRDLVRPMVDLNLGPRDRYPKILIAREDEKDLSTKHRTLVAMVDRGLEVEASVVRDELGYPEPAKGARLLQPGKLAPDAAPAPEVVAAVRRIIGARLADVAPVQPRPVDQVDRLVEQLRGKAAPLTDEWFDQVVLLLDQVQAEGGTLADVADRLASLYPEMEDDQLGRAIGEALGMADLTGRGDLAKTL
ncbi:MAG: DUF935 domain-containing protein [Ferrovibrionaceae bacterium]